MGLATPKRLAHLNLTKSHKHAPKMEKAIAARLGGLRVKGSGSGAEKGDVRIKGVLRIEAKCTTRKSFTVTRDMIDKIEMAALASGELPAIEIEFINEKGQPTHRVAVVSTYILEMICEYRRGTSQEPSPDRAAAVAGDRETDKAA